MSKTFEKFVFLEIDNIRVTKNDELNYVVETLEKYENEEGEKERYAFRGYCSSITGIFKLIVSKSLMVDQSRSEDVQSVLNNMLDANDKIMRFIKENAGKLN